MKILLRTVVALASWFVTVLIVAQFSVRGEGANIGLGLLMLGLGGVGVGTWAAVDGLRWPMRQIALTWIPVAVLLGLGIPGITYLTEPGASWSVLATDAIQGAPFLAFLFGVPALIGGLIGNAVGGRRTPHAPIA